MPRLAATLALVLLAASCRDRAAEAYARAELQYRELIDQAVPPDDPRFEGVVAELQKVPQASRHHASAQRLLAAIRAIGAARVRTPLALGAKGTRPPELEAQFAACARLAAMAGADGGIDQRILRALDECRARAEKLELQFSHPGEYDDAGAHLHDGSPGGSAPP